MELQYDITTITKTLIIIAMENYSFKTHILFQLPPPQLQLSNAQKDARGAAHWEPPRTWV